MRRLEAVRISGRHSPADGTARPRDSEFEKFHWYNLLIDDPPLRHQLRRDSELMSVFRLPQKADCFGASQFDS